MSDSEKPKNVESAAPVSVIQLTLDHYEAALMYNSLIMLWAAKDKDTDSTERSARQAIRNFNLLGEEAVETLRQRMVRLMEHAFPHGGLGL